MNKNIADLKSDYHDECRTLAHHDGRSLAQAPRNINLQESVNLCAAARLQFQRSCAPTIGRFSDAQSEINLFRGLVDETERQKREFTDELWGIGRYPDAQSECNLFRGLIDETECQKREFTDELWEIKVR